MNAITAENTKTIDGIAFEEYKNSLFMDADWYNSKAVEAYELGDYEEALDFEHLYTLILDALRIYGWDKEYMGIA